MQSLKELADKQELAEKETLLNLFKDLILHGYKCFIVKNRTYGYIITPDDNVLCISPIHAAGWDFSFEYRPSKQNGNGCRCFDKVVESVNLEIVQQAEKSGYAFACNCKAPLFTSSSEWQQKYWAKDDLEEVTPD